MRPLFQELPFTIDHKINFYKEDLPFFIVPYHFHPKFEIICIENGFGTRFVGDHIEKYQEGDVCLIGPNLPHEWRNDAVFFDSGSKLRASCFCIFFSKEMFDKSFIFMPEMNGIRSLLERSKRGIKFFGDERKNIQSFIQKAFQEEGIKKIINLLELLKIMSESSKIELLSSIGFSESINSDDFERFKKVYQYLANNYQMTISLEKVADIAGLTTTSFCRYFKQRTKKTFVNYLIDMRIGQAKKLLIEDKLKISFISAEVGFNNLSNFIDHFKKKTGMTPSDFRNKFGVKRYGAI